MARLGSNEISLRAPGILSFMLSVILAVITMVCYFFAAEIPFLETLNNQFWAMVLSQAILVFGCLVSFGT
ncbi:MAG: hypothetical protein K0U34_02405 [Alphaproteobacteria bacterium]|nr:hypothetical protein [Alphaproteobacteria bacterium]